MCSHRENAMEGESCVLFTSLHILNGCVSSSCSQMLFKFRLFSFFYVIFRLLVPFYHSATLPTSLHIFFFVLPTFFRWMCFFPTPVIAKFMVILFDAFIEFVWKILSHAFIWTCSPSCSFRVTFPSFVLLGLEVLFPSFFLNGKSHIRNSDSAHRHQYIDTTRHSSFLPLSPDSFLFFARSIYFPSDRKFVYIRAYRT